MTMKNIVLMALIFTVSVTYSVGAEEHGHKNQNSNNTRVFKLVTNETYLKECSACHFAYQPELLPARSWQKIMDTLDKHFGTDASLPEDSKATIHKYLTERGAEKSPVKKAQKLLKSISQNETPARISEIKFFKREHRKITQELLQRKTIGSISNCNACHTTADKGNYDEDLVSIPKK